MQLTQPLMKKFFIITSLAVMSACFISCEKEDETDNNTAITGAQSPMGQVGTEINSSSVEIEGVSNFQGVVVSLSDGISSYNGSCIVTNAGLKNMLANVPQLTIKGDTVIAKDIRAKSTVEGIQVYNGLRPGVLVNYNSSVGTSYPITNSSDVRTVMSKSTTDDYPYGFMFIKVMKIEEPFSGALKSTTGISKITYWANHRFGLVGIRFDYNDGSSSDFPLYTSTENN